MYAGPASGPTLCNTDLASGEPSACFSRDLTTYIHGHVPAGGWIRFVYGAKLVLAKPPATTLATIGFLHTLRHKIQEETLTPESGNRSG